MKQDIIEYCSVDILEENMFLDDIFNDAILGVCFDMTDIYSPAYDIDLLIEKIQIHDNVSKDIAIIEVNKLIEKYPMISFIKYSNESCDGLAEYNNEMLFLDNYDLAMVGVRFKHEKNITSVYDDLLCVQSLIENDGMTEEDAIEYFEYNTRGAFVGDNTPVFLTLL
jgi:hypothetical protein